MIAEVDLEETTNVDVSKQLQIKLCVLINVEQFDKTSKCHSNKQVDNHRRSHQTKCRKSKI